MKIFLFLTDFRGRSSGGGDRGGRGVSIFTSIFSGIIIETKRVSASRLKPDVNLNINLFPFLVLSFRVVVASEV